MPMSALLLCLGLTVGAHAAPTAGHYHPDQVAQKSEVFHQAAVALGPRFDDVQGALARLGRALEGLDLAVATLGTDAPPELVDYAAATRRTATGQYIQVQRHVDLVQEDTARTFEAALARAVDGLGSEYDLEECGVSGVAAMMGRGGSCKGTDLNPRLAEALDADPELRADVGEIAEVPWPEVTVASTPQPVVPVTGTARWVAMHALVKAFADPSLDGHTEDLEDALAPLEDGLAAGDAKAIATAEKHRATYEAALAADGQVLRSALKDALEKAEKKGGLREVGLCANPGELGGCAGEDVTREVIAAMQADKRFLKATAPLENP